MCTVWKLGWMKTLKAKQTSLLNENWHHLLFKECVPNEGYSTLVRKLEKRASFHFESSRRVIIVHLYITVVKVLWKLWPPCDRRCVKIILDKNSLSIPLLWLPRHQFELDAWTDCWVVSESGTENISASDSSSESQRPPWCFSSLVKIRADFGSALNTQLLDGFFARTELLPLAGVDSLVLVVQKRDRSKTRSSSVVVRDCCSLPLRAHDCRTVPSFVHWKLVSYRFLWALVGRQCYPFYWGLLQML